MGLAALPLDVRKGSAFPAPYRSSRGSAPEFGAQPRHYKASFTGRAKPFRTSDGRATCDKLNDSNERLRTTNGSGCLGTTPNQD